MGGRRCQEWSAASSVASASLSLHIRLGSWRPCWSLEPGAEAASLEGTVGCRAEKWWKATGGRTSVGRWGFGDLEARKGERGMGPRWGLGIGGPVRWVFSSPLTGGRRRHVG
ncbi:hypothetical protein GUJ93_ZPchr0013g37199 [Zizania palustris]|uniref:Uncharacterized protein n=1 Tax=Zizania palustris TaxID=103762 RepID=A0A8J5X2Y4_ZIZPA|nr:hypothetical protein GUJ93_ZPchr0013g37199 [Zizania palustris]